jgi:hypothetical protein
MKMRISSIDSWFMNCSVQINTGCVDVFSVFSMYVWNWVQFRWYNVFSVFSELNVCLKYWICGELNLWWTECVFYIFCIFRTKCFFTVSSCSCFDNKLKLAFDLSIWKLNSPSENAQNWPSENFQFMWSKLGLWETIFSSCDLSKF